MNTKWTDQPFSLLGHTFDWFLLPEAPEEEVRFKKSLGFDAEHWLGSRFKTGGDDGASWMFRTRHGFLEDRLGPYLPAAHARGLKVLVYINAHWYQADFGEEMLGRDADGKVFTAYGSGVLTCPAGPFLDYCLALAEDLGEYAIDGVFLDGPIASQCYCQACRAGYRERFGEEMPRGPLALEHRRRAEQFVAGKVAHFVGEFRRVLRARQPQAVVYANGASLGRLTWSNRRTIAHADLLGAEGGFIGYQPLAGQFLYKTAATGKLLASLAGGKPTVVFNDHAFKGFDYFPLPRPELDILYAATIAAGANPWFLLYYYNRNTQAAEAARHWNGFIAKHRELLAGARPADAAAVLWSDSTALVSQSAREAEDSVHHQAGEGVAQAVKADHAAAFRGAYAMLARSGIGFRIVVEEGLEAALAGVQVLIAPSVVALEEAAFTAIEKFVRGGGMLLADDRFAALDAAGRPRDANRLAALLGGVAGEDVPAARDNIDYIARGRGPLFAGTTRAPLPRPTRAFRTRRAGGKTLARLHQPLAGRYDYLPPVSRLPAAIENACSAGRVVYMPMNLFEHYAAFGFDDHRLLAVNAIRQGWRPPVVVDGLDGRGEVLVARKPGRLIVHLLNYGGAVRPFARITPLRNVRLTVTAGTPAAATALHAGKPLPVRPGRSGPTVRLPRLEAAETVVLDMQP